MILKALGRWRRRRRAKLAHELADLLVPRILAAVRTEPPERAAVDQGLRGITPDQAGELRETLRELYPEEFAEGVAAAAAYGRTDNGHHPAGIPTPKPPPIAPPRELVAKSSPAAPRERIIEPPPAKRSGRVAPPDFDPNYDAEHDRSAHESAFRAAVGDVDALNALHAQTLQELAGVRHLAEEGYSHLVDRVAVLEKRENTILGAGREALRIQNSARKRRRYKT